MRRSGGITPEFGVETGDPGEVPVPPRENGDISATSPAKPRPVGRFSACGYWWTSG